jgi:ABC-2 type transport system permease protein
MNKFIALVKNEIIKLSTKASSKILISVAVLASVAVCLMFFIGMNMESSWGWGGWDEFVWMQERLEDLERNKPYPEWENEAEQLRFQIEHRIGDEDWRSGYVYDVFQGTYLWDTDGDWHRGEPLGQAGATALINEDWRSLYTLLLNENIRVMQAANVTDGIFALNNWRYEYSLENNISPVEQTWKNGVVARLHHQNMILYRLENSMPGVGQDRDEHNREIAELKDMVAVSQYRLDNNVSRTVEYGETMQWNGTDDVSDVWSLLEAYIMLIPFMSVFVIIIAGGIVSGEFSKGTIKFLLINPVKRWKIITSKYVVMLLTAAAFLTVTFGTFLIFGSVLTGFTNIGAMYLTVENAVVSATPALAYFGGLWLLSGINIIVMSTLAFSLSSLTRNSGLAIAVSIAAVIGGSVIDSILRFLVGVDWGRYLIFANVDLVSVLYDGTGMVSPYPGQTLTFTIGVLVVHMLIFGLTAWDGFTKQEI